MEIVFSERELELVKCALSYLSTHREEASDELDTDLSAKEVDALEAKIYGQGAAK